MNKIIFWYWSLLSPKWWNATLDRKIGESDMIQLDLGGYTKVWTPVSEINFDNWVTKNIWVFLDLEKSENSVLKCFGIKVTDEEFDYIRKREWWYEMVDVTDNILSEIDWFKVFTSIVEDKQAYKKLNLKPVITKRYFDFVETAISELSEELIKNNRENTRKPEFEIVDWKYWFCNTEINKFTWHSNNKSTI